MKSVVYTDVLYRAAELAGRTRDKLPTSEATILQSSLAVDLADVWGKAAWPELTPAPVETAVVDQVFSKNEGEDDEGDEIGDVLTVLSANPRVTTRYRALGFQEGDNEVWIDEPLASVWVEAMLPLPDLMELDAEELAAYLVPQRFRNYLSLRAAAQLLASDGMQSQAAGLLQVADLALTTQMNRLPSPPEWRQVRVRSGFGRRRGTNLTLA